MSILTKRRLAAITSGLALALSAASGYAAQTIGVDFQGRGGDGAAFPALAPTDTAGVIPQQNWNSIDDNAVGNVGTSNPLLDSTGAATSVTVSFKANDSWNSDGSTVTTGDAKMMKGIIKANGANVIESFSFDGLADGRYDVYVYMTENGAGSLVNVYDGNRTQLYYVQQDAVFNDSTPYKAGLNTDPNGTRDICNYVKFSGLNTLGGSSLAINVLHVSGTDGSGVGGLQIVNVGGPAANTAPVSIANPPTAQTGAPGGFAVFSVLANGPLATYKWFKNGEEIPGATSANYTTPTLQKSNNGDKYKVQVSNNVNSVTSAEVLLSVVGEAPLAVDFIGRGGNGVATAPLNADDIAGVVAQGNWNSVDDSDPTFNVDTTIENLVDATGAVSPITLTFHAADAWFNDTPSASVNEGNSKMMQGIMKATGSVDAQLNFNNVPEGIYDAYVYINENGDNTFLNISDDKNFYKFYVIEPHQFPDGTAFKQATNRDPNGTRDLGNYVKLAGLNTLGSGKIGLTVHYVANSDGAGIGGVQLVPVGPAGPNTTPVAIYTQPTAVSAVQPDAATFSVGVQGPNAIYQWQRKAPGGSSFSDVSGATSATYKLDPTSVAADNGATYRVVVHNNVNSVTSSEVSLTVTADTTPPQLVDAGGTISKVRLSFSEPLDLTTAQTAANYSIPGLTISSATLTNVRTSFGKAGIVELAVSGGTVGKFYTATVNNVKDVAGNAIAANSKASFFLFTSFFDFNDYQLPAGLSLGGVANVQGNGFNGTGSLELTSATGSLSSGLIIPDQSGGGDVTSMTMLLRMYIGNGSGNAADGLSINYSTDLGGITTTGEEGAGSGLRVTFDTYDNGGGEAPSVSWWYGGTENDRTVVGKSDIVNGRYVYVVVQLDADGKITVIHDGRTFVDHADAAASGYAPPLNSPTWLIGARTGGEYEAHRIDDIGIILNAPLQIPPVTITFNPAPASATILEGRKVTLSATAVVDSFFGGSASYQWQSAPAGSSTFTDIDGATGSTYKTPKLALSDNGIKYRVVASTQGTSTPSAAATITVNPDTIPPVAKAGAVQHKGGVQVGVSFDETVDKVSAGAAANYTLSAGSINAVKVVQNNGGTVNDRGDVVDAILDTTGLTPGSTYTVTVKGVKDIKGNAMSPTVLSFKVPDTKWASVGSPAIPAAVAPVGDKGFDVISGGRQYWSSYDEITFVYKEKTGDFDVKTQIIDQDYASRWARGGFTVREATDEDHTQDETTAETPYVFSAYREIHANANANDNDPNPNGQGTTTNNSFEANRRTGLSYGATNNDTDGWGGGGPAPAYPNVWLRLQRVGNQITGYRSEDGTNWTQIAQDTWNNAPAKLLVGPGYGPENGNSFGTDTTMYPAYMIQYRNFSDTVEATAAPEFTKVTRNANGSITVEWTGGGTLQTATSLTKPITWTPVSGATSPYTFTPPAGVPMLFGRIVQ